MGFGGGCRGSAADAFLCPQNPMLNLWRQSHDGKPCGHQMAYECLHVIKGASRNSRGGTEPKVQSKLGFRGKCCAAFVCRLSAFRIASMN